MNEHRPATLALEDGTIFRGSSFGSPGTVDGEVVFNTGMTGYLEILTDPSYRGQMVCMTYPLIGNYGITTEDFESRGLFLSALIIKERSRRVSNWRSRSRLEELLSENGVMGIEGIDTRRLVRHIRLAGAMKAVLSTEETDPDVLIEKAEESPGLVGRDCVQEVTCEEDFTWNEPFPDLDVHPPQFDVVVVDCGVKYNILRMLVNHGCRLRVVRAYASAEEILAGNPDGVLIANGPGDPAALPTIVEQVRLILGRKPVLGICLGHQILGQALGAKTYKLKFGHHGCNHPVKNLATGKVEITSQNHGFCVDPKTLPTAEVEVTHVNLNDDTVEGIRHREIPAFSVQYHPEACPGPHDSRYLFEDFIAMMRKHGEGD